MRRSMMAAAMLLAAGAGAQAPVKRPGVWAQSYTGRLADPAIRFGRLPNGLRYAVMHNATPPGQMSLRLYIGSGSMAEADDQQGLAHFLEHMAFRGSTHVPDGEMMRVLQRHGLAFGADTNAATGQTATIFQFDFPQADTDSIATGLGFLREIAGELTLSQASMDSERGVILSEERLRDTPAYRAAKAELGFDLAGQRAPTRWPIGKAEVIKTAPASLLRAFYEAHYRPDNAVVIAVGDFDAAAMEAQIKARFGDWTPKGQAAPVDLGAVERRGEQVRTFTEPGAPERTQVAWARPYDDRADTDARERDDLVRLLASVMLNQRFADLAQAPDPPFLAAGFGQNNILRSANLTDLSVTAAPDKRLAALKVLVDEQRRALAYGFTQAELDRARARAAALFGNAAAGNGTRRNVDIVGNIVSNVEDDEVATSPAQDWAQVTGWLPGITLAETDAVLPRAFAGAGPLLFVAAQAPPPGGEAAIRTAFDAAEADTVAAGAGAAAVAWPYTSFGPAGRVIERRQVADLGLTQVRFANGVALTIKPTAFAADEVQVTAAFGGGRLQLPRDRARAYWTVDGAAPVFVEGGTRRLGATQIGQALAGRVTNVGLSIGDDAFFLRGRTRPADLATELQLLTAYLGDPGFRPEAFARMQPLVAQALPQTAATPLGVLGREAGVLLHDGDRRWSLLPDAAGLAASRPDDVPALLRPALAGPLELTIVGAVDVDAAIAAAAATVGTLPARPAGGPATATVSFPQPTATPIALADAGRADQAVSAVAWPTVGFFGHEADARALSVAAAILQTRVTDRLRTAEGTTYSPAVQAQASDVLPDYGYLLALVEVPPAKLTVFRTELAEIVADLAARPVSADELARAKGPLVAARKRNLSDNAYWTGALAEAQRDPRRLESVRTYVAGIAAVSAADVQRVVARYLRPGGATAVTISAAGAAPAPAAP